MKINFLCSIGVAAYDRFYCNQLQREREADREIDRQRKACHILRRRSTLKLITCRLLRQSCIQVGTDLTCFQKNVDSFHFYLGSISEILFSERKIRDFIN